MKKPPEVQCVCVNFYIILSWVLWTSLEISLNEFEKKKREKKKELAERLWILLHRILLHRIPVNGFSQVFHCALKDQLYFMICISHIQLVTLRFKNLNALHVAVKSQPLYPQSLQSPIQFSLAKSE